MKHVKPMNENNNSREILPQMVSISNNSRITTTLANAISKNLSPSEFNDFKRWIQLVEQKIPINKRWW